MGIGICPRGPQTMGFAGTDEQQSKKKGELMPRPKTRPTRMDQMKRGNSRYKEKNKRGGKRDGLVAIITRSRGFGVAGTGRVSILDLSAGN